jgi:GTP cyclohydrolase I
LLALQSAVKSLIQLVGENPNRPGLIKTPDRVAKSLGFLTSGYAQDIRKVLNGAVYSIEYDEMVIVKDIDFFSMCEHHLLPFFGKCHIAYLPNKKIVGLSKLPRIVDIFSRRLQVQEKLTMDIAHTLEEAISPKGVAVVMDAQHLCMMMRGVEKQNAVAVTSCMLGMFRSDSRSRSEFLSLIKQKPI